MEIKIKPDDGLQEAAHHFHDEEIMQSLFCGEQPEEGGK